MLLLEGIAIKHYVQARRLFDIQSLKIYQQQRIGLIGRNGSGKTTLLKVIAGEMSADEGNLTAYTSIKLVPQLKETDRKKSGGEITQTYLQHAFNAGAGLLLLDEPTTHLDTNHLEWVEKEVKAYQGALVIVSHDREFLNQVCTEIWELNDATLTIYKGNYNDYAQQKELEKRQEQIAFEQYEKEKQQLQAAIRKKEERAKRATKKPKNLSGSEARIKGAKPYYANKQKKLRKTVTAFESRLAQLEEVKKPKEPAAIQMDILNEKGLHNQIILRVEQVAGKLGERTLWQPISFYLRSGEKLGLIGANGTGKTTLLQKIIRKAPGIHISPAAKIGYFAQNLSILHENKTILENIQSTSKANETLIRIVLARLHFVGDAVNKKINVLSGGEKVKVSLAKIFLSDVNLLILDEPTNFLDIEALEALENLLADYPGTIIFATHDRMFIKRVATKIASIENETITLFDGTFAAFEASNKEQAANRLADKRLLLETKITDVLSRLSIEPSEELEAMFQQLLQERKRLNKETEK